MRHLGETPCACAYASRMTSIVHSASMPLPLIESCTRSRQCFMLQKKLYIPRPVARLSIAHIIAPKVMRIFKRFVGVLSH